jgi:hypothetical protein
VNWYAHALAAERHSPDPRCVLGAMLPDFASALRLRLAPPREGALALGCRLHVAADAAFHRAPEFLALVAAGRAALEAAGVARGPARAAAHVGVELRLDGWLARRHGRSAAFAAALALAADLAEDAALFRPAPAPARWRALCARLAAGELPEGYDCPARAALGVERALAGRARLALSTGERARVERWLAGLEPVLDATGAALLASASAAPAGP